MSRGVSKVPRKWRPSATARHKQHSAEKLAEALADVAAFGLRGAAKRHGISKSTLTRAEQPPPPEPRTPEEVAVRTLLQLPRRAKEFAGRAGARAPVMATMRSAAEAAAEQAAAAQDAAALVAAREAKKESRKAAAADKATAAAGKKAAAAAKKTATAAAKADAAAAREAKRAAKAAPPSKKRALPQPETIGKRVSKPRQR